MNQLHLYGSGLISLLPFISLVVEDAQGRSKPEVSLVVLTVIASLSAGHLWLRERDLRLLSLLGKGAWTAGFFIAGAFIIPIYWCLHIFLPARMQGATDERTFVLLTKESNPLRAHMLKDVLLASGIDLRIHGTEDAAGVGMGQFIVAQRFEVPREQLEDAQAILNSEALTEATSPELSDDEVIAETPADDTALASLNEDEEEPSTGLIELGLWLILTLLALRFLEVI